MRNSLVYNIALAISICSWSAQADDAQRLSKEEVEALVAGKQWPMRLQSDGSAMTWDFRGDGNVFASHMAGPPANYGKVVMESGKWSVDKMGQLCVKWRNQVIGGFNSDPCVFVVRFEGRYRLIDAISPQIIFASLIPASLD